MFAPYSDSDWILIALMLSLTQRTVTRTQTTQAKSGRLGFVVSVFVVVAHRIWLTSGCRSVHYSTAMEHYTNKQANNQQQYTTHSNTQTTSKYLVSLVMSLDFKTCACFMIRSLCWCCCCCCCAFVCSVCCFSVSTVAIFVFGCGK